MVTPGPSRTWRRLARRILGEPAVPLVSRVLRQDDRTPTFVQAVDYVNFEAVPGDIVEAGVFGGLSLAILARAATFDPKGMERRIVGVDSFEGLPASEDVHARWTRGDCASISAAHPVARPGEPVTPDLVRRLFEACDLAPPILYRGSFAEVLPTVVPSVHPAIALLHVDCDLYESTRDLFLAVGTALQDGTIVLFDDWFHYKAHPGKGEARAFQEFLSAHPEWTAVHWKSYATFGNAFILVRR
jgi:hypothetical protein